MMASLLLPHPAPTRVKKPAASPLIPSAYDGCGWRRRRLPRRTARDAATIRAFFNPCEDQPILKNALKEPVVFMGGMFAGLLRIDLNEEPLREWVVQTVEAAGIATDAGAEAGVNGNGVEGGEDAPRQIMIE